MSKPFRIGLVMQGGANWMGGAEYIKNIILALASLPAEVRSTFEIYLLCDKSTDIDILSQIEPHLAEVFYLEYPTLLRKIGRIARRDIFSEYNIPVTKFLKQNSCCGLDFVYPYFTTKPYQEQPLSAAWIPDFQHKYLTEFFTKRDINRRDKEFNNIAKHAPIIVLSSESAKSDFCKFFPNQDHKTKVLPFVTIPSSEWHEMKTTEVLKRYNLPERFFLISNQFWQHKNHITVFRALEILQNRGIYPIIVCTGNLHDDRNKGYANTILESIEELGISEQVYLLGMISKSDQIQLLRATIAVIQPSLFEGWSTIVEESKYFGQKIILSDLSVHIEQNPCGGIFFKRDSPDQLSEILANCWNTVGEKINQEKLLLNFKNTERIQSFAYNFLDLSTYPDYVKNTREIHRQY
jgi:glycosyltransferase involved in cell wall biosynthesis